MVAMMITNASDNPSGKIATVTSGGSRRPQSSLSNKVDKFKKSFNVLESLEGNNSFDQCGWFITANIIQAALEIFQEVYRNKRVQRYVILCDISNCVKVYILSNIALSR